MTVVYYTSPDDAKRLKKEANAIGESTIHHDFIDVDGRQTDGKTGRLTFGIKPDHIPTRKDILTKKLRKSNLTLPEINELLRG